MLEYEVERKAIWKKVSNYQKNAKNFGPGTYGNHEALHMASAFCSMVDDQLCNHPSVLRDKEAFKLACEAVEKIAELYQHLGKEHFDEA